MHFKYQNINKTQKPLYIENQRHFIFSTLEDFKKLQRHSYSTKNEVFHKDFVSKCDQLRWKLRIWSHLLRKIFRAVSQLPRGVPYLQKQ